MQGHMGALKEHLDAITSSTGAAVAEVAGAGKDTLNDLQDRHNSYGLAAAQARPRL